MSDAENVILRGFVWSQQIQLPAGTLEPNDEIFAEFRDLREQGGPARFSLSTTSGITVADQLIEVALSAAQTATLAGRSVLYFDFKVVRGGAEYFLGPVFQVRIRELVPGFCPEVGEVVESEIDRILTQYRESPRLLGLARTVLGQAEEVLRTVCSVPSYFDLDWAAGDQLTLVGKRLGFPRCHCICDVAPVFGFCADTYAGPFTFAGFCEPGTWANCGEVGDGEVCITDDEVYRGFLKARRYQALGLYDIASLQAAARWVWGDTAIVESLGGGKVVVGPGRILNEFETRLVPVAHRVLPIAPGVKVLHSDVFGPIFGFGAGWGGLCEDAQWLCPVEPYAYSCP